MYDEFYQHLPRIETARLVIRPFSLGDVDDYFAFASDPEVTRYLRWGPHPNRESTADFLQNVLKGYANGEDEAWGIELKTEGKLIGTIHLMELNRDHQKAHIGVVLARPRWQQGYAKEAVRAVLHHALTVLELHRIEAFCITENYAAIRLLEAVEMQREGYLRQYQRQKDVFQNFLLFALLQSEQKEVRENGYLIREDSTREKYHV